MGFGVNVPPGPGSGRSHIGSVTPGRDDSRIYNNEKRVTISRDQRDRKLIQESLISGLNLSLGASDRASDSYPTGCPTSPAGSTTLTSTGPKIEPATHLPTVSKWAPEASYHTWRSE